MRFNGLLRRLLQRLRLRPPEKPPPPPEPEEYELDARTLLLIEDSKDLESEEFEIACVIIILFTI